MARLTSSKRGKQARLLAEAVEIAVIAEKLPEGTRRSSWLSQAERMAGRYEASVVEQDSIHRDPAGIAIGIGFTGADYSTTIIGLFGSVYEGSGRAKKEREDKAEARTKLSGSTGSGT